MPLQILLIISVAIFALLALAIFLRLKALQKKIGQLNQTISQLTEHSQLSSNQINQYHQALSADKLKLESIINAITDGVIALDFNNLILTTNTTAQKLTGYTLAELTNQPFDNHIQFSDKDGIKIALNQICNPNHSPNSNLSQPLTLIGKGQLHNTVRVAASQITNQTPSNLKCLLILRDISQENALQGIQIDFVSMASHELRTPLTNILGYLSVFIDENKTKLNKDQLEFLDRILISAKQLGSLIDNLLNVSKVERNAFSITTQRLNWSQVLTKAVEDNRLQAAHKNISLTLDPAAASVPNVLADPIRIVEVINNLIVNAINYTHEGGKILVGAHLQGNEIVTYVKDTGVGIPQEALNHLFTKFYRVQGALDTSSNSSGSGLGLYLAKSIVDLHHGRIWVESTVGQGSTFFFTLSQAT